MGLVDSHLIAFKESSQKKNIKTNPANAEEKKGLIGNQKTGTENDPNLVSYT